MFLGEHLGTFAPRPVEYSAMVLDRDEVVSPMRAKSIYRDHALQWVGVKQSTGKSLVVVVLT